MKYLIILLFLSCSVDMGKDTVKYKTAIGNYSDNQCEYEVRKYMSSLYFHAPCDMYDVGDSLNKWYRIAKTPRCERGEDVKNKGKNEKEE